MTTTVRARFATLEAYVEAAQDVTADWRTKRTTMVANLDAFFSSGSEFGPRYSTTPSLIVRLMGDMEAAAIGVSATAAAFRSADMGLRYEPTFVPTNDWVERQRRRWLEQNAPDLQLQLTESAYTPAELLTEVAEVEAEISNLRHRAQMNGPGAEGAGARIGVLEQELDSLRSEAVVLLGQVNETVPLNGLPGEIPPEISARFELRRGLAGFIVGGDTQMTTRVLYHLNLGATPADAFDFAVADQADFEARLVALEKAGNLDLPVAVEYFNIVGEVGLGIPGIDAFVQAGGSLRVETMADGTRIVTVGMFRGVGASLGEGAGAAIDTGDAEIGLHGEAEVKGVLFVENGATYELPPGQTVAEFVRSNIVGSLDPADYIPDVPSVRLNPLPWGPKFRTPSYDPSLWEDPPDRTGTSFTYGVEGSAEASALTGMVGAEFFGPLENLLGNAGGLDASLRIDGTINSYDTDGTQGYEFSVSGSASGAIQFIDIAKDEDGNSVLGIDYEGDAQFDLSLEVVTDRDNNDVQEIRLNVGGGTNDSYSMHGYSWDMEDPAAQQAWDDFRGGNLSFGDLMDSATGDNSENYTFTSDDYGVKVDATVFQGELIFEHVTMDSDGT